MTSLSSSSKAKVPQKKSYTVPCSSTFRDAALALAQGKQCNVADIARSVVLVVPLSVIEAYDDPGGPLRDDRETIVLKSGTAQGKPWRRKPRLQVRMATGLGVETIRKALALAFAIERGELTVGVKSKAENQADIKHRTAQETLLREADASLQKTHEDQDRLQSMIKNLYFDPLPGGINTREQALFVLGFAPGSVPDQRAVRGQFRRLAVVYHPDGKHGCHERMSQLNAAMELLRSR